MAKPQGHFYHYTTMERVERIMGFRDDMPSGMLPQKRFITLDCKKLLDVPDKAFDGVIFGLMEPVPESWAKGEYNKGEGIFELILNDMSGGDYVLLKIDVEDGDDIYVADHGYHLAEDYNGHKDHENPATARVKTDYWNSLVPFDQYVATDPEYVLPEVICFSKIPVERVTPIRRFERYVLINQFREKAGFELMDKPPPPKEIDLEAFLGIGKRAPENKPA